jgi:hypothetical protein
LSTIQKLHRPTRSPEQAMTNRFVFSAHDESSTGIPLLNPSWNDSERTGPALDAGEMEVRLPKKRIDEALRIA